MARAHLHSKSLHNEGRTQIYLANPLYNEARRGGFSEKASLLSKSLYNGGHAHIYLANPYITVDQGEGLALPYPLLLSRSHESYSKVDGFDVFAMLSINPKSVT